MKNITTVLLVLLCSIAATRAQTSLYFNPAIFRSCDAGTNSAIPTVASLPGLSPPDSLLPCISATGQYADTIHFKNFSTFSIATVTSFKFDSIYLPAGLCWSTNKANNTFATGEDGVIIISGTPTVAPGTYKLRIIADINLTTIGNLPAVDVEQLIHLRYHVRIACSNGNCPTLDPSDSTTVFASDTSSCNGSLSASIYATGPTTLCSGDSVGLVANYGSGYTYLWSTGATTQSIAVGSGGTYVVTVSHNGQSVVSAPVQVVVSLSCPVDATISPSGPVNICYGASQMLAAPYHAHYSYLWSTGATTQAITATTPGTYSVTVSDGTNTATDAVTVNTTNCGGAYSYWNTNYFSNCNNGFNAVPPRIGIDPGLSPADAMLPCLSATGRYADTIYFKNYSTFSVATVNSLKIDSIYLPAGLCWSTNKANNTFATGEDGVIVVEGQPTAPAGSYKLRIIADVNTSIGTFAGVDIEPLTHLRYHIGIGCSNGACPTYDPNDSVSLYIPDTTGCGVLAATIYANGSTALCSGDSVTLTANYGPGYTYLWSTGATTQAIRVSTAGSYTVTVSSAGRSAISAPVQVVVAANCVASAAIYPPGPVTVCSGSTQVLSAPYHSGYHYIWSTGQTSQSITVSTAGVYSVTVAYGSSTATDAVTVTITGCGGVTYSNPAYFSNCNSGVNSIAPQAGAVPGLSPTDTALPCLQKGSMGADTIYFKNFTAASVATIYSLKIDSIYLPAGLCWSTNKANNTFTTGEDGVILISGTPYADAGTYKLRIVADLSTSIGNFTADLESLANMRYHVRISCPSYACPVINLSDTVSLYVPDNRCGSGTVTASIGGPTAACTGTSVSLYAQTTGASSYLWSTGATTSAISVTSSGTYGLTAYGAGGGAIATPVTVTFYPAAHAEFTLVQDPSAPHTWAVVNQCTGSSPLSYTWLWGDGFISTGASPTHTYDSAGYYTICVSVTDTLGCSDRYCDSNAHLFKADGQMISLRVVQYALGINAETVTDMRMSYYGGAIHFSEVVNEPSDIALYDMSGRVVMARRGWTGKDLPLDEGLADGVYIVSLQNNAIRLSGRIGIVR